MLASPPKPKTRIEKWPALTMPLLLKRSKAVADFRLVCQFQPYVESLGLISFRPGIIASPRLKHYPNISAQPLSEFVGSAEVIRQADLWQQAGRKIVIAHSHPPDQKPWFSAADLYTIERWNCAGLLFCATVAQRKNKKKQIEWFHDFKHMLYFDSSMPPSTSYEGRPWQRLEANCFSLVRDYLANEKGFDLESAVLTAARSLNQNLDCRSIPLLQECLIQNPSLPSVYAIAQSCLIKIGDRETWHKVVQEGDVLAFTPSAGWPVHLGIMANLESNSFLHHPYCRRSQLTQFDSEWRRSLIGVYRVPNEC
jgi:proteasome lid subunit RPN8/RPN11